MQAPKTTARLLTLPLLSLMFSSAALATPTENYGLRLLPAPANIKIDGKADDWNLSAGIFASNDVEHCRDDFAVWVHGAYDANNVYLLAHFLDKTPLDNPGDTRMDFGWGGDCLQVRFITHYDDAGPAAGVGHQLLDGPRRQ